MIFGHISLAFLATGLFSTHLLLTNSVGNSLSFDSVIFLESARQLSDPSNILCSDYISFFLFHPDSTSPCLKTLCTVYRPQVPRSIKVVRFSSLLFSPISRKNADLHLGHLMIIVSFSLSAIAQTLFKL